jgi:Na+/H+-translocating membrane pyrophosphatase
MPKPAQAAPPPSAGDEEEAPMAALPTARVFSAGESAKLPFVPFAVCAALSLLLAFVGQGEIMVAVVGICLAAVFRVDSLAQWVMALDEGSDAMRDISLAIREGSTAFFKRVYGTIFRLSLPLACVLVLVYGLRSSGANDLPGTTPLTMAVTVGLTFLAGAGSSALAGYVGLWISVRTNVRTTAAAARLGSVPGSPHPVTVALMGGAVAATVVVCMVVFGLAMLYSLMRVLFPLVPEGKVPLLLVVGWPLGARRGGSED